MIAPADNDGHPPRHQHPLHHPPVRQPKLPPKRLGAREGDGASRHRPVVGPAPSGQHRPVGHERDAVAGRDQVSQVPLVLDALKKHQKKRAQSQKPKQVRVSYPFALRTGGLFRSRGRGLGEKSGAEENMVARGKRRSFSTQAGLTAPSMDTQRAREKKSPKQRQTRLVTVTCVPTNHLTFTCAQASSESSPPPG